MPGLEALTQPVDFQPDTNSSGRSPSSPPHLPLLYRLYPDLPIGRGATGESGPAQDSIHSGPTLPLLSGTLLLGTTEEVSFQQARQQGHLSFYFWAKSHSPRRQSWDMPGDCEAGSLLLPRWGGVKPRRAALVTLALSTILFII